jgi:hypothetical protein
MVERYPQSKILIFIMLIDIYHCQYDDIMLIIKTLKIDTPPHEQFHPTSILN